MATGSCFLKGALINGDFDVYPTCCDRIRISFLSFSATQPEGSPHPFYRLSGIRYRSGHHILAIFLWLAWIGRPGADYIAFEIGLAVLLVVIAFYRCRNFRSGRQNDTPLSGARNDVPIKWLKRLVIILLIMMMCGYFFAYVITPYELEWHIDSSIRRLYIQVWPAWVFLFFYCVKGPELATFPSLRSAGGKRGTLPPARFYHNVSREDTSWN